MISVHKMFISISLIKAPTNAIYIFSLGAKGSPS